MTSTTTTSTVRCLSCRKGIYFSSEIGTCKKCYQEESEIVNKLTQEIDDLEAKVAFLRFWPPLHDDDADDGYTSPSLSFTDVMLVATSSDDSSGSPPKPISVHKAILVNRSPVFKAMLENDMEESKSGTIKISDAPNDALRALVNYLYTADQALLVDEQMGCHLLVLAEKYMVKHLKEYCEKFLSSQLDWEKSLTSYAFAHQHNAKRLRKSALSLILDNMDKLTQMEEYKELVEKDPRLVVEIYEAFLRKVQTKGFL